MSNQRFIITAYEVIVATSPTTRRNKKDDKRNVHTWNLKPHKYTLQIEQPLHSLMSSIGTA